MTHTAVVAVKHLVKGSIQFFSCISGRGQLLNHPLIGRDRVGQLTKPLLESVQLKVLDVNVILHLPRPAEVRPGLIQLFAQDLKSSSKNEELLTTIVKS